MNWNFISCGNGIYLHSFNDKDPLHVFNADQSEINDIKFNSNGRVFASGGNDGLIRLSHISKKQEILQLGEKKKSKSENVNCLSFSSNSQYLATGYSSGTVKLWNLKTKKIMLEKSQQFLEISAIQVNKNDSLIACGTTMGDLQIYSFSNFQLCHTHSQSQFKGIKTLNFSPHNSELICTGDVDGSIGIFKLSQKNLDAKYWKVHSNHCTGIQFSPQNENILISVGFDENLNFLDLRQNKIAQQLKLDSPLNCMSISSDANTVVVGSYFGKLISVDTRKPNAQFFSYKGPQKRIMAIDCVANIQQKEDKSFNKSINSYKQIQKNKISQERLKTPNNILKEQQSEIEFSEPDAESRILLTPMQSRSKLQKDDRYKKSISQQQNFMKLKPNSSVYNTNQNLQEKLQQQPFYNKIDDGLKEELKTFIRKEMNNLRLDLIKEFEIQKTEIKQIVKETILSTLEQQNKKKDTSGLIQNFNF